MIGAHNVTPLPAEDDRDGKHSLAVILMLAGSAVMFFALLLAYALLRARAPAWPPPGSPSIPLTLPLVGTAVLAASSVALQRGLSSVRAAKPHGLRRGLIATLVLGGLFLGVAWTVILVAVYLV